MSSQNFELIGCCISQLDKQLERRKESQYTRRLKRKTINLLVERYEAENVLGKEKEKVITLWSKVVSLVQLLLDMGLHWE